MTMSKPKFKSKAKPEPRPAHCCSAHVLKRLQGHVPEPEVTAGKLESLLKHPEVDNVVKVVEKLKANPEDAAALVELHIQWKKSVAVLTAIHDYVGAELGPLGVLSPEHDEIGKTLDGLLER